MLLLAIYICICFFNECPLKRVKTAFFPVSVCLVEEIQNGYVDSKDCIAPTHCQVGTILQYVCKDGFIGSNSLTKCLDNYSWDLLPTCVKEGTNMIKYVFVNIVSEIKMLLTIEIPLKIVLYFKITM